MKKQQPPETGKPAVYQETFQERMGDLPIEGGSWNVCGKYTRIEEKGKYVFVDGRKQRCYH